MLEGMPSTGEQKSALKPSNKLMERKCGYNWIAEQAVELQENSRKGVQQKPPRVNRESAARGVRELH